MSLHSFFALATTWICACSVAVVKNVEKNFLICFVVRRTCATFAPEMIGLWCNGNTADSGPAFPGSSPGSPTKKRADVYIGSLLLVSSISYSV